MFIKMKKYVKCI